MMLATNYPGFPERPLSDAEMNVKLAHQLFGDARNRERLGWLKSLLGRQHRMPLLSERLAGHPVRAQHTTRVGQVEVGRIVGSESRVKDFDAQFNPRTDDLRARWVRILQMRLRQLSLPAVELFQVGQDYFVRDGHHRVSVARALGTAFIDAQVTVIEISK